MYSSNQLTTEPKRWMVFSIIHYFFGKAVGVGCYMSVFNHDLEFYVKTFIYGIELHNLIGMLQ